MLSEQVFIGMDPAGGRKPLTYAALDAGGRLVGLAEAELDEALAFVAAHPSAWVAVNAPPRPNAGLVRESRQGLPRLGVQGRAADMRLAEHSLRERGINVSATPARRELCANWVQIGFDLHRRLESLGFLALDAAPAARIVLETHPQACFAALLGQLPLARPTLEGRLQRQLVLYEQGLAIRDPMDFFEELTRHKLLHGALPLEQVYTSEQLDALAAAFVAWFCAKYPLGFTRLGDAQEGQVILPIRELKSRY